jgi:hypothetical protein
MMDATKPDFIEAAIYKVRQGGEAGQYVATCAKDKCGYAGESSDSMMGSSVLVLMHLHSSSSG